MAGNTQAGQAEPRGRRTLSDLIAKLGIFLWLIVLAIIFSLLTPDFLSGPNLLNIAKQSAIIGIAAVGMTFVIITGGIDLSVGSLISFAGAIIGWVWVSTGNMLAAAVAGLLTGAICGTISGLLVGYAKLPPFIATFGMMGAAAGLAFVVTPVTVGGFPPAFEYLGNGKPLGIPSPIILMLVVAGAGQYVLSRTRFGLRVLAIGGNEPAARLAGINVPRHKAAVYLICGTLSALGAVVLCARLRSAYPGVGQGYELLVIAATAIGGTDLMGGSGTVIGSIAGALLIGEIQNGLNLLGVAPFMQQIVTGCLIVVAVLGDQARTQALWARLFRRRPAGAAKADRT